MREGERREWDQQEGETAKAYLAFTLFRDMGAGRTLTAAYDAYRAARGLGDRPRTQIGPTSSFKDWVRANRWQARVAAWDAHLAARTSAVKADAIVADAELVESRRAELSDRVWRDCTAILDRNASFVAKAETSSQLRDSALVNEKTHNVLNTALYGRPTLDGKGEPLTPEQAEQWERFLAWQAAQIQEGASDPGPDVLPFPAAV